MLKKLFVIVFMILILLSAIGDGFAQEPQQTLESLQIAFWPDFDRQSVLVLFTGQLAGTASLPAEVTLPLPEDAELNAVAQIDDSGMVTIPYDVSGNRLTLQLDRPRFRVEYYVPYQADGLARSYAFSTQFPFAVNELSAEIQQPANALSMTVDPEPARVVNGTTDDLVYYSFDSQALPAGSDYGLSFSYEMANEGLTAAPAAAGSVVPAAEPEESAVAGEGVNWLLLAGIAGLAALLAMAVTWFVTTRRDGRKSKRPRKPAPRASEKQSRTAVYCHNCGRAAEAGDQFCRQCGTKLKNLG